MFINSYLVLICQMNFSIQSLLTDIVVDYLFYPIMNDLLLSSLLAFFMSASYDSVPFMHMYCLYSFLSNYDLSLFYLNLLNRYLPIKSLSLPTKNLIFVKILLYFFFILIVIDYFL